MSSAHSSAGVSHGHTADVEHHVKIYQRVLYALLVLTLVTVGASYLHLGKVAGITLALFIATVKSGMVACYFMHLIDERKMIYYMLALTVLFFFVLLAMPTFWHGDPIVIR